MGHVTPLGQRTAARISTHRFTSEKYRTASKSVFGSLFISSFRFTYMYNVNSEPKFRLFHIFVKLFLGRPGCSIMAPANRLFEKKQNAVIGRIKALLTEREMDQRDLANKAGMKDSAIH